MERFLLGFQTGNQTGGGESLVDTIKIAVLPIAKVFTICFMGFLLAYFKILPANGRKLLNGLVFSLLLPCLIFSQLGQAITLEKMIEWWFIPFNVLLATISGSLIGLAVATIVGAIVLYTYVFYMLAPPSEGTFDIEDRGLPLKNSPKDSTQEQVPLLMQEAMPTNSDAPKIRKIKDLLAFVFEKLKVKQILHPPIIASILAMVIGCVPFLKRLVFTNDAPLYFFTDSCTILGDAMIPSILLALGGNLIDGPGSSKLGIRTTAAIVFGRLVLVPPAGLGIVMLADKLGFLPPGDKMFRFVLLLQHSMPTSVLSGAVANLRGCGREGAAVLFWVHIFAILSMSGWIVLYLHILF
ncbi:hypothetical protein RHGRI_015696 [Rhododendron griersonianum]|uniref:Auxin efflux carrier family protein n=1 Tax=Rhododendron griersonianum TaxID=479676 RepID=A0AAV6KE84_9ERIC|nr:hypothetical protein RHGRI_015696 [Rhododendron griersonianum]